MSHIEEYPNRNVHATSNANLMRAISLNFYRLFPVIIEMVLGGTHTAIASKWGVFEGTKRETRNPFAVKR